VDRRIQAGRLRASPAAAVRAAGRHAAPRLGWGIWHVPLYGPAGFVVPLVLASYHSWLYNKTRSVLLCILLHTSFTPAQDHLLLTADSPLVDAVLLSTYVLGAGALIALTRGRLGYEGTQKQPTIEMGRVAAAHEVISAADDRWQACALPQVGRRGR
jgi:Type II CAAX prenyl endopeptidase Rce1-like